MLRFGEVTYLYNLDSYNDGRILEINTNIGYADIDTKRGFFWTHDYTWVRGIPQIPAYYVRKEDVLYLMKEEPQFYA